MGWNRLFSEKINNVYWRDQNSIPGFRDHARLTKKYLSIENSPYGKEREIQIDAT